MDHLGAVLGDAAGFVVASYHESGDVLQEHKRDTALVTELDEMSRFEGRFAEQDSIVGDDADWVSVNAREPRHQRRAVARFELAELAAIYKTRDDFMDIVGLAKRRGQDAVEF